MHRTSWVLQIVLGLYFVFVGALHFVVPDGLPAQMSWMYELSTTVHSVSGLAEIAGGLGLILPSLTRIKPQLTPLAGVGLIVVMLLAAIWHVTRGEVANVGSNVVLIVLLAVVVHVRWRTHPIAART